MCLRIKIFRQLYTDKLTNMKKLFLFSVLSLFILFSSSCYWKRVKGNGNIITSERSVSGFTRVEAHGAFDVYVSQGSLQPVKIEADENLMKYIEVEQHGETIEIRNKEGVNLKPTGKMKVYVTSPEFNAIDVSGACDIIGQTKITNSERLDMQVSGAGDIKMEVDAPVVKAQISGAGTVNLKGQAKNFDLDLSGAGKARCYDLMTENTSVDISGAGSAEVYASLKLDAEVSGAGNVRYKGGASNVSQQVSGAGSVKKVELPAP